MLRKVLVADDEEINRIVLRRILGGDYEILEAANGREVMEILQRDAESISAVLLDIVMPEMNGYSVLDGMQQDERLSQIPVIVTTGSTESASELKALSMGAYDYVTKPYHPQVLCRRLWNAIRLRETAAIAEAGDGRLLYCTTDNIEAQHEAEQRRLEAEENQRSLYEQLQTIMNNVGGGVSAATLTNGRIGYVYVNDEYYAMFGYTERQFKRELSGGIIDLIHPDDLQMVYKSVAETENGGTAVFRFRAKHREGHYIWVKSISSVCRISGETKPVHIAVLRDITGEVAAAEQIRQLNENLMSLMNDVPGGYARIKLNPDRTTEVDYVNEGFVSLIGMTSEEILSQYKKDVFASIYPEDVEVAKEVIVKALHPDGRARGKFRLRHKNNEYVWVQMYGSMTTAEDGTTYLNVYFSDFSEQEKREISFRETMPVLLKAIMSFSEDLTFAKDKDFRYICCSEAFARFAGQTCEAEVVGKTDFDLFDRDAAEQFRQDDVSLFESGRSIIGKEEPIPSDDGLPHYSITSKYILRDTFGDVVGLYGAGRDITRDKNSYAQLKLLTDSIPGGLATYICSPGSIKISYFNDGFCRLLGCTRREYERFSQQNPMSTVFAEDYVLLIKKLETLKEDGLPIDCTYRIHSMKGEGFKWINLRGALAEQRGNTFVVNTVQYDVTQAKLDEEKMKKTQEEMRLSNRLVDDSSAAVYVCDTETYELLYINKTCARLCNQDVAEARGKTCYSFLKGRDKPCQPCYMDTANDFRYTEREYTSEITGRHYMTRGKLLDWDGRRAMVEYLSDETERVENRLSLEASHRAMEMASLSSGATFWRYDIDKKKLDWGDYKRTEVLGYPVTMDNVPDSMIEDGDIYPADAEEFRSMFTALQNDVEGSSCTIRLLNRKTNKYGWYHIVYTRVHDPFYSTRQAVGFAANADLQQDIKKRYEHELQLRTELIKDSVIYYELNLTQNMIVEYRSKLSDSSGMSDATPLTDEIRSSILEKVAEPYRELVQNTLFSKALRAAYRRGETGAELTYLRRLSGPEMHWVKASASIMKQPGSDDVFAFMYLRDIEEEETARLALHSVLGEEIDSVAVIDTQSGLARMVKNNDGVGGIEAKVSFPFDETTEKLIRSAVIDEDIERCIRFYNYKNMIKALEKEGSTSCVYGAKRPDGTIARKRTIAYYLDDMHKFIVASRRDVTKLYEEEQQQKAVLKKAMDEANVANQAKSDFLSRMSHDMRTPMNAIIGLAILARDENNPPVTQEYLESIDASSHYLLGLLNDVLDLSRIESGKLELNEEPFSLEEFAKGVDTVIRPLMKEKNIDFGIQMDCGAANLVVDKLRFNQIFYNLLSNAAKYTPERGCVDLIAQRLPDRDGKRGIRYTIRDNGIGMSEEFLKIAFDPFSQERSEATIGLQGTGLGLAIVKNLVTAMGGDIRVKSKLGEGTEFTVDLYAEETDKQSELHEKKAADYSALKGLRVLLAEDNDINVIVARKLLERRGCEVTTVNDGEQAVKAFSESEENYYAVILMDVRMPGMDGMQATRAIRALDRADAATIPIIAMTADAFINDKRKTLEVGMNAHVTKPIEPGLLYDTITYQIRQED